MQQQKLQEQSSLNEVTLNEEQKQALAMCADTKIGNRIVCVTGKAGTGKSTLIARVYDLFKNAGYRIGVCAPTGKAARRVFELTGIQAVTIHRMLGYSMPSDPDDKGVRAPGMPKYHKGNRMEYDCIIVDEYSMVNNEVHRNLLNATPHGGVLRMFGDINQLRPIEENKRLAAEATPFDRLMQKFPSTVLEHTHRQGAGSGILSNAELILKGRVPKKEEDFAITLSQRPVDSVVKAAKEHAELFRSTDGQIITPTRLRGWISSNKLNAALRLALQQPRKDDLKLPRPRWYKGPDIKVNAGDKVIWTVNNYYLNVFNGEVGIVSSLFPDGSLSIDFGDRELIVPIDMPTDKAKHYDPRQEIELAYAITTHKAQGSEFKRVLYVMNRGAGTMLCRPQFYTAVTRAREFVHLITDHVSLQSSVRRMREPVR